MRWRFWSDTDELDFIARCNAMALYPEIVAHEVEVPDDATSIAVDCNATAVQGEAETTSGVDGLLDTSASSVRSSAEKMPYYTPTIAPTFFGKPRRSTRGQPL